MRENEDRLKQVFNNIKFENEHEREGAERLLKLMIKNNGVGSCCKWN